MVLNVFDVLRLCITDVPLQDNAALANIDMTSEERKELRYQRRKVKRRKKRDEIVESIGTAENVFTYHDMFKYGMYCCKNVMWKQSVQSFNRHLFSRTAVNKKHVLTNYKPKKLKRFTLRERGKIRQIEAPSIDDRQIQKTLSKKVLIPLYQSRLIYDNGASLKNKGLIFSQKQMDKALKRHYKKYGLNGWVIITDFKGYFPNADRIIVKSRHLEIRDKKLREILDICTDVGCGKTGLPLGVEPSQLEMISFTSPLDNYMCCQLSLRGFGHYMDDYHIFVPPDKDPKKIFELFVSEAKKYKISVSREKTQIIKFGKPFKYCKMKRVFDGKKIIKHGCSDSRKRARRKIKKYAKTDMRYEDVFTSVSSSIAYFRRTNNHGTVLKLRRLFYALFGFSCEDLSEFRKRELNELYLPQKVQQDRSERKEISFPKKRHVLYCRKLHCKRRRGGMCRYKRRCIYALRKE